jgi:hypothetical protein
LPREDGAGIGVAVRADLASTDPDLPLFDDGDGHAERSAGGEYQLGARQTEAVVGVTIPQTLPPDQLVEATFTTTGSPADTGFGVICRWQSNDEYYRLGIGNDGTYAIARVEHGQSTVLTGGGQWVRDRRLARTPGQFTVGSECRGSTLTLFANHEPIISVQDSTFDRPGRVGVFVETFTQPNATVTVNSLRALTFRDREQISDETAGHWDAFTAKQGVDQRCELLDPARAHTDPKALVTRCGSALFVDYTDPPSAARAYAHLLKAAGTDLDLVKGLPRCRERTGIRGALPDPGSATGAPLGFVACLNLGDGSAAVAWLRAPSGTIGIARLRDDAHRAWKDYGPSWPPFLTSL